MSQYFAVATLAGQAKIAAAVANQGTINITAVAVGDGNGLPITPAVNMIGLVREIWRGAPAAVSRDPALPTQVLVQVTIPGSVGPATIRELALFTDDGQCIVVANYPATDLAAASQGAVNSIDVLIPIVVDTAANVTIQVNPASLIPLSRLLRAPFIGIDGFFSAPPANPALSGLVVVGTNPSGAFANRTFQFAQWDGTLWLFANAPLLTIVGDGGSGKYYQRVSYGWRELVFGGVGTLVPPSANTFYVAMAGSDSNDGLSPATAFATIQGAINAISAKYITPGQITVNVAPGTYAPFLLQQSFVNSWLIAGNPLRPSDVVIDATGLGQRGALAYAGVVAEIAGFSFRSYYESVVSARATLHLRDCAFAAPVSPAAPVLAAYGGALYLTGQLSISGSMLGWVTISNGGSCLLGYSDVVSNVPLTMNFAASFTTGGVLANSNGTMTIVPSQVTFAGAASGPRFVVSSNAVINSLGSGANFLPGNAAGTASTGGQFV